MTFTTQPVSKQELQNLLKNRVSLDYNAVRMVYGREISDVLEANERIFHNQNTYVGNLIFENCVFNETVKIGNSSDVGDISFRHCIFNKCVTVDYKD